MAPPTPPSNVLPFLQQAAQGTGLPLPVVEAQNDDESGYGSNLGPSSAGALGPWQFEPGTWTSLGFPAGQENNWTISTQAYVKYMNQLLGEEGGSVFKALEAYNAGPGNLGAGAGYASHILSVAGEPQNLQKGQTGTADATTTGIHIPGTGITIPTSTGELFGDLANGFLSALGIPSLKDLFQRLALILLGFALLIVGIRLLSSGGSSKQPFNINLTEEHDETTGQTKRTRETKTPVGKSKKTVISSGESTGASSAVEAAAVA